MWFGIIPATSEKSNTNSQLLPVKVNGLSEKVDKSLQEISKVNKSQQANAVKGNKIFEKETKGNTTFKVSKSFQEN
ncbi:hypothetical protein [Nautilia sp.]